MQNTWHNDRIKFNYDGLPIQAVAIIVTKQHRLPDTMAFNVYTFK